MSYGNRRFRRLAATGALALGSMALLPASPASAARDTDDACPAGLAEDSFTDTGDDGSAIESAVDCVAAYGVTSGTSATTFDPSGTVTRAQMATFIMNKLDLVDGFERPADAPNAFTDDEGGTHEANINDAAASDIVQGFTDDVNDDGQTPDYQPSGQVTRAQMATFIVNSLEAAGFDLPEVPEDTEFTDIEGHTHEDNIKILEALDIVDGLAGDNNGDGETPDYGPDNPVSRGQMAFFLTRDLDVLVEQGLVEPLAGPSNQTLTVTPAEEVANPVSTAITGNEGRHTYTVTGLDTDAAYDIALLPAESVTTTGATISFSSVDTVLDNTGPSIEVVNGALQTTAGSSLETEQVNNVTPSADGTITFSIDSYVDDQVIPVVWLDAEATGDNTLDLNADGTPSEDFGVGGQNDWIPAEALATDTGGTVTTANTDLDYFIAGGDTYFYDSNDIFRFQGGANLDMAAFEGMLTVNDDVAADYDPDADGASIFDVTTDVVPAPTGVTATVSDLDDDTAQDDVSLAWTASTQGDAVYDVYEEDGTNVGFQADEDTLVENDVTGTTAEVVNVANGDEFYVVAQSATSSTLSAEATTGPLTVPPADPAPIVVDNGAVVAADADDDGAVSSGDVWHLFTSEAVSVASDATIVAGGATYENGLNATIAYDATLDAITVTLTDDPAAPSAYPANVTSLAGVTDADEGGQALDLATSVDTTLEDNGVEALDDGFAAGATETTVAVTFNEELIEVSAENEANYVFTDASGGTVTLQSAVLGTDNRTVTFTFSGALATDDTLDIQTTLLDTDGDGATAATLTVV